MSPFGLNGRVILYLAVGIVLVSTSVKAADVVVVKSKDFPLYDKPVAGFQASYKGSLSTLVMKGALAGPGKLASAVRKERPQAILAVGLRAAKVLKAEITDIPVVLCMAMHLEQNKQRSRNGTGVSLEPLPGNQRKGKEVSPGKE